MTVKINGRTDGQLAPRNRVGVWFLCAGVADNLANGSFYSINPFATDEERQYNPVYRSWQEKFVRQVDPCRQWIANGDEFSAIIDFERPVGILGDNRRFFDMADLDRARRYGNDWMYEGLAGCIARYVDAGNEVVVHMGRLNSDQWAHDMLSSKRPEDKAEVMRVAYEAHVEFIKAGARIGIDNLMDAKTTEPDYAWAKWLMSLGVPIQGEATADIHNAQWKGVTTRIVWALFNERHVLHTSVNWPAIIDPAFKVWYPDLRVTLTLDAFGANPADVDGDAAAKLRWLNVQRDGCRDLLKKCPNVSILLNDRHVTEAIAAKWTVKEFLPQ